MKLSPHFTLAELTDSATARRLGLDNTPPPEVLPRLVFTAEMLERIRSTLGAPITITSGYRSAAVNKAVGGVTSSDHSQGHAADFVCPGFGAPFEIAKALAPLVSTLGIGQVIYESFKNPHTGRRSEWVHVSTRTPERASSRVITITEAGTQLGIKEATA